MVLTICKDFFWQIVRIFCHDLTDRSCPRLTPLFYDIVIELLNTASVSLSLFFTEYETVYLRANHITEDDVKEIISAAMVTCSHMSTADNSTSTGAVSGPDTFISDPHIRM